STPSLPASTAPSSTCAPSWPSGATRHRTSSLTTSTATTRTPPSLTCSRWRRGSTGQSSVKARSSGGGGARGGWPASGVRGGGGLGGVGGAVLAGVFGHAVEVGKRARSETAISRGTTSVSQAAVAMAAEQLGTLEGKRVLVLGAGEMGEGIAQALAGSIGSGE